MDPETEKRIEQWVAYKDAVYAKAGFPADKRRQWADYNRAKYARHLAQSQPQLQHEQVHPAVQTMMQKFGIRNPQTAETALRKLSVPSGPFGWNYEEQAEPALIPNARGIPGDAPAIPAGPVTPGRLVPPTDPQERQRWFAALSGGPA